MYFNDWIFVIFNGRIESRNSKAEIRYLNIDEAEYKIYVDRESRIIYFNVDDVSRTEFHEICEMCKPKSVVKHITKSGVPPSPQRMGNKKRFKTIDNNPMTKGIKIPGMRSDIRLR